MTREQAQNAYRRLHAWEHKRALRRREAILNPYFGGCGCRMHNCQVSYERGVYESPVNGKNHKELVALARKYEHEQREDWRTLERLGSAFARYF